MGTPYAGDPSFPTEITLPDGSDADDAATAAVPLTQLADRTAYCKERIDGGLGFEFTDAILHGNTTLPDGTLVANVASVDLMAGKVHVSSSLILLADDVNLGGSTADSTLVVGTLQANHNATFVAGKTVTMDGVTNVADLRAVVSNAAGIQLSGAGSIRYRMKELVDADFPLGAPRQIGGAEADFYYIDILTVVATIRLAVGQEGNVVHVSFQDASLAAPVNIDNWDGSITRLANCSASVNTYSMWLCYGGTAWRRLIP